MELDGKQATIAQRHRDMELTPSETKRLVQRCKTGERGAFDDLIRRYEKKVYNFAYRLSGNYDEANDVASETFVRVFNALHNFRGDSSFITWLFRIVTNVYLDEKKRQRNRPHQSLEEIIELEEASVQRQIEDPGPTPEVQVQRLESTELLQDAINSLPEYQRMMIVMYHTDNRSYDEIAAILDLPIGTVKSRLNRARLSLRDKLEPLREHFPI
ncbi:MAG: sigma-70 family RNA polymerase sigma factor [Chthonomonadales bacterium]